MLPKIVRLSSEDRPATVRGREKLGRVGATRPRNCPPPGRLAACARGHFSVARGLAEYEKQQCPPAPWDFAKPADQTGCACAQALWNRGRTRASEFFFDGPALRVGRPAG
jgi:hypothetical protein